MILIELTQVPDADLPVAAFRDHLQLGSGFADDGFQDAVLLPQLRAALSAVEARIGKALLEREFKLVVTAWRDLGRQVLPVAPVSSVDALTIVDLNETTETIPPAAFRLIPDAHTPALEATALSLPIIPIGGTAEIEFTAGYGDWATVPGDLKQAVLLMATHFYENRSASSTRHYPLPMAVASLCRPHTPMRLVGVRRP